MTKECSLENTNSDFGSLISLLLESKENSTKQKIQGPKTDVGCSPGLTSPDVLRVDFVDKHQLKLYAAWPVICRHQVGA